MASTIRDLSRAVLALASLALAGPSGAAHRPRPAKPTGPISYTASSVVLEYRTQHALLRNVIITQGDLRVSADRAQATGLNFKDSRWTLTGEVRISSPEHGDLTADTATIEFRDEGMRSASVSGNPAKFEQTASRTGVLARGHADSIVYTVAAETVQLKGDAWLEYGSNEITGPALVYDIASQKLQGASTADHAERVHITIRPKPGAPKRGDAPAPTPAPAPAPQASSPEQPR
jgi:lipopolysaccharide transport protein LptA